MKGPTSSCLHKKESGKQEQNLALAGDSTETQIIQEASEHPRRHHTHRAHLGTATGKQSGSAREGGAIQMPAPPSKITAKLKGKRQVGRFSALMAIIFNVLVDASGLVRRPYLLPGRVHPLHRHLHQAAVTAVEAALAMAELFRDSRVRCFSSPILTSVPLSPPAHAHGRVEVM